jgi:hypothetical protein
MRNSADRQAGRGVAVLFLAGAAILALALPAAAKRRPRGGDFEKPSGEVYVDPDEFKALDRFEGFFLDKRSTRSS